MSEINNLRLKAKLFNGFSDLSRLKIIQSILKTPLNVTEIVKITGLSQPNVSSHLKCLFDCDLIVKKKDGRKIIYSIIHDKVLKLLQIADELLQIVYSDINACVNYEVID